MKLSLAERETILLYNQADPMAEIYTHDPRLMEKLTRLSKKHPEQVCKKGSSARQNPANLPSGKTTNGGQPRKSSLPRHW